ncbi:MAG: carbon storage regulator CsrA [bacterium]|nr:carbon storage regulator CsrA [bacterium]
MLVLSRKLNQSIIINDDVEIMILDTQGDQVKLGIKAPRNVKIFRKEIYEEIQKENIAALKTPAIKLQDVSKLLNKKEG